MARTARRPSMADEDDMDMELNDEGADTGSITIERTGKRPLMFEGELVEEMYGVNGKANRWHDISVYKTAGFKFVVVIKYTSNWEGEIGFTTAEIAETPDEVADVLEHHDCTSYVQGFPPISPEHVRKQEALLKDISLRYKELVSFILSKLPGIEEVVE